MMVVYIDKILLFNWLIDYLLLLSTARLGGVSLRRCRLAVCSLLGALYAVVVFLPEMRWLAHPVCRLCAGVGMALLAYWPFQRPYRLVALFILLSAALAGAVLALGLAIGDPLAVCEMVFHARFSWPVLLASAITLYGFLHLIFRQGARHGGGELMHIHISVGGQTEEVLALHDTGNTLRDPIRGQPVLVVEARSTGGLWGEDTVKLLTSGKTPEEKMAQLHEVGVGLGFTLLPYRSVGASAGLLLAVRSDYVQVGRAVYRDAWVALAEDSLSDGGAYTALWGGVMRGERINEEVHKETAAVATQNQQAG